MEGGKEGGKEAKRQGRGRREGEREKFGKKGGIREGGRLVSHRCACSMHVIKVPESDNITNLNIPELWLLIIIYFM